MHGENRSKVMNLFSNTLLAINKGVLNDLWIFFEAVTIVLHSDMACLRLKMLVQNYCNCSYNSFSPSEKWLRRYNKRHNIKYLDK